jgi:hypothetical protein
MLTFNPNYFAGAVVLFLIELLIALFVRDSFVRPYVGDYLVVFLVYCAVRAVLRVPAWQVALGVLLFAYFVELLQYVQLLNRLGLEENTVVRTVMGYGFEWLDLMAYTLGVLTILSLERKALGWRQAN